ncbi:hypothetical protein ACS0TY_001995 [Phlomoides rotata]
MEICRGKWSGYCCGESWNSDGSYYPSSSICKHVDDSSPFAGLPKDTQPGLLRAKDASKKLMDMEQIIKDAVESLRSKDIPN